MSIGNFVEMTIPLFDDDDSINWVTERCTHKRQNSLRFFTATWRHDWRKWVEVIFVVFPSLWQFAPLLRLPWIILATTFYCKLFFEWHESWVFWYWNVTWYFMKWEFIIFFFGVSMKNALKFVFHPLLRCKITQIGK